MTGALLPVWIIGGPLLGLFVLSIAFQAGSSASVASDIDAARHRRLPRRSATLDAISRLSGPVSPGAISALSGPKSPGAIASLSGWRSPGAISRLSGWKSPGAISALSGPKSPGAIAALSKPRPVGAIAKLSAGFYVSNLFGLPLLTRSQAPLEPEESLLIRDDRDRH